MISLSGLNLAALLITDPEINGRYNVVVLVLKWSLCQVLLCLLYKRFVDLCLIHRHNFHSDLWKSLAQFRTVYDACSFLEIALEHNNTKMVFLSAVHFAFISTEIMYLWKGNVINYSYSFTRQIFGVICLLLFFLQSLWSPLTYVSEFLSILFSFTFLRDFLILKLLACVYIYVIFHINKHEFKITFIKGRSKHEQRTIFLLYHKSMSKIFSVCMCLAKNA